MSTPKWFEKTIQNKPESKFVNVNGAEIHYLLWGDPLGQPQISKSDNL